jgi:hypothetical protein
LIFYKKILDWFCPILITFLSLTACEKFEGSQTIPSYFSVDTFKLLENTQLELGLLSHNITDVWVRADEELIGAFELHAGRIPVLLEGNHKLTLIPGIKYNGMSGTRGPYPFLQRFDTSFFFYKDSIINVLPQVQYLSTTLSAWLEDFDDYSISLKPSSDSDTSLQLMPYPETDPLFGYASGKGFVNTDFRILEVATFNEEVPGIELPGNSAPVFLEMHYNTDISLLVGLFIIETGVQIIRHPVVVLNPTYGIWKKIYINFTPAVSDNYNADYFNVFLRAELPDGYDSAVIKIDNLKLLTNKEP